MNSPRIQYSTYKIQLLHTQMNWQHSYETKTPSNFSGQGQKTRKKKVKQWRESKKRREIGTIVENVDGSHVNVDIQTNISQTDHILTFVKWWLLMHIYNIQHKPETHSKWFCCRLHYFHSIQWNCFAFIKTFPLREFIWVLCCE